MSVPTAPDDALPLLLHADAVKWSIGILTGRRIHPVFLLYLHLRKVAVESGRSTDLKVDLKGEIRSQLAVPGNRDLNKPLYRPLVDTRVRQPTRYWITDHLGGSWAPSSLRQRWLVSATRDAFELPMDHCQRAVDELLIDGPVPVLALASYLFRNAGFTVSCDSGHPEDIVAAFRNYFRFPASDQPDFDRLFEQAVPLDVSFAWFEPRATEEERDPDG